MDMNRPRPIYYLFIATATDFVLAVGALIILLFTGLASQLPSERIGFLLAYNAIIATLVLLMLSNNSQQDKRVILKGGGLILGHLVGLVLGGLLGLEYGGLLWGIIGAISLYFIVGQIGSGVSFAIGAEIDRITSPTKRPAYQNNMRLEKPKASLLFTYAAVIPALFMVAAVFLKISPLMVAGYSEALSTARVVVIGLSLGSILAAWSLRTVWMAQHRKSMLSRRAGVSVIGLVLCMAPALFGFLLFWAFGISLVEVGIFTATATLAAMLWVQTP
jgi:uncharacterized membrane protein